MSEFQSEYWNDERGRRWAQSHQQLDALMQPFADALMEHAVIESGQRIVDVGCGAGATTFDAARRSGAPTVGVDISQPLLAIARRRAEESDLPVDFVEADAASWNPQAPIDLVISRFGVMFFPEPAEAFRNIRSWLAPGGRFVALAWCSAEDNAWISEPVRLLSECLDLPDAEPHSPGPHALADADRTRDLLARAGFEHVELRDLSITMRLDGDLDTVAGLYLDWGPTARFLEQVPEDERPSVADAIRRFCADHHDGTCLELVGRTWVIEAF